ncbi:MAG: hypothetical protein LBF60_07775 [Treponema sp.]|jgi:hypothetical protein|nr:hypothetical protein [Treponema sp.]
MKKKPYGLIVVMFLFCGSFGFAESISLNDLQDRFDGFSEALAKSLPFNANIGLNWSDAYIGQFLDAPPHFGVGLSAGATTIDVDAATDLLKSFDVPYRLSFLPLPAYVVEGRLGGFIIPFDIGVKFGALPDAPLLKDSGVDINFLLAGADFRYGLIKQGVALPNVSIGFGVNYLKGGISAPAGDDMSFTFNDHTLALAKPRVGLSWETVTLELKAQVSKQILIITPYIGAGVSYAVVSKAGYDVKTRATYDGDDIEADDIAEIREAIPGLKNISGEGFSSSYNRHDSWGIKLFGGLSFNLLIVKIDLTGMFNLLDQNYGVTLGVRAQL